MSSKGLGSRLRPLLAVGLVMAATAALHSGVPLYDGVGFPDEPYRYVVPPAGTTSQSPASSINEALSVKSGTNDQSLYSATIEQGPQALVYMPEKTLSTGSAAKQFFISMKPLAPGIRPVDGAISGNVYRLNISTDNKSAVKYSDPSQRGVIELRLPQGASGQPIMEFSAQGTNIWYELDTTKTGTDIYQSLVSGLGDYAMVLVDPKAKPSLDPTRQKAINQALNQITAPTSPVAKKSSNHTPLTVAVSLGVIGGVAYWLVSIRRDTKKARSAKHKKAARPKKP